MKKLFLAITLFTFTCWHAHAAVTVFGSKEGEACYLAANSPFGTSGIGDCDQALRSGALDRRETAGTHVNRGILYLRAQNFDAALKDFEEALRIVPNMPEAYVNRGNAYFMQGKYEAALADYDAAIIGETKQIYAAYYNRGLVRERLGQKEKAIEDFKIANSMRPGWQEPRDKLVYYGVTPAEE